MGVKQLYGYFFYTFYRLWLIVEGAFGAPLRFTKEKTASICMLAVEIWLGFAVGGYIGHFFNIHVHIPFFIVLVPCAILFLINWFIFEKNDKWKDYVHEFDKWAKGKNRKGASLGAVIILLIIVSFFTLFTCLVPE
jgi:predicted MFS family arabinose efflux permease